MDWQCVKYVSVFGLFYAPYAMQMLFSQTLNLFAIWGLEYLRKE